MQSTARPQALTGESPKTSLFEGGGPPQRWKEFVPRRGAHCAPVSYIAAPVTVITTMFRESARRVIGATAKPLYPIDGKAGGLDRQIPQDLPLRGRGTAPWAVEGVRNPDGGRRSPRPSENSTHMLHMLHMPKAYDVFFKNHQVSFRRMSRSSACFFHRINVF